MFANTFKENIRVVFLDYEVIKETFIPIAKVKEILKQVKDKTYEQKLAYEHVKKFSKINLEKAEKLIKELLELEMRKLKEHQIVKIVDLMPKDVEELKVILEKSQLPFKDDELEKIIEIVKKYE